MPPLPKHAKRKFHGILFDIYQWPQKQFDGSLKTFEKAVRQNTVVIIPTIGNKIVMVKQKQPGTEWFYDLPSGRMDKPGESPQHAALRELKEETGLVPKEIKLWKIYQPSGKVIQKVYFFIARGCEKKFNQALDSGEQIIPIKLSFKDFLKYTDKQNCFLGPLMLDVLLARIHKENRQYLENSIFGLWQKPPKLPKNGPRTNW